MWLLAHLQLLNRALVTCGIAACACLLWHTSQLFPLYNTLDRMLRPDY
jgi:hypothetical protein